MKFFFEITNHAIQITSFVFVMMLIIEYINVLTSGSWQEGLLKKKWIQYLIAAVLGATPGCLGAFIVVAMYTHRLVSFGALAAAMIATSGDESFIMLAMIPKQAILIMGALAILGAVSGAVIDMIVKDYRIQRYIQCDGLLIHPSEQYNFFPGKYIIAVWKNCSLARGIPRCAQPQRGGPCGEPAGS